MSFFITGDTHGAESFGRYSVDGYLNRFNSKHFPEGKTLNRNDYVIIVGDFGGIWQFNRYKFEEDKSEEYNLNWLENKPWTTLFVPGNHENYDRLIGCNDETLLNSWFYEKMPDEEKQKLRQGYPRHEWNGGNIREIRPHILMLEDGIFTIDNETFLIYGGADSHDIEAGILYPPDFKDEKTFKIKYREMGNSLFRVEGMSWWKAESTSPERERSIRHILDKHNWSVDHVLTHACTTSDAICCGFIGESKTNEFLETIEHHLNYSDWHFGHIHKNENIPWGNHTLLYDDIVPLSYDKEQLFNKLNEKTDTTPEF